MKGENGIIFVIMISSFSVAMLFSEIVIRENFNEAIKRFMGSSSHGPQKRPWKWTAKISFLILLLFIFPSFLLILQFQLNCRLSNLTTDYSKLCVNPDISYLPLDGLGRFLYCVKSSIQKAKTSSLVVWVFLALLCSATVVQPLSVSVLDSTW